jgi:uncharacterized protein (TIRG00374 family)
MSQSSKSILSNLLRFALFLGTGLGILFLLYRSLNSSYQAQCALDGVPAQECDFLGKIYADFLSVNLWLIGLVLLAFTVSNISRAIRWRMLLRPLGCEPRFYNLFFTIILGYFANLAFPRVGEFVRGTTLARYEGLSVEKTMGTVVVDRIADVLSILVVMALAFMLEFDKMWGFVSANASFGSKGGGLLVYLFVAALLSAALLYALRGWLSGLRIYQRLRDILRGFGEGLATIRHLDHMGWFLFHSIVIWAMYYFMTLFCFMAFPPTAHLTPLAALVVFVFGGLGIVIPSPGGMGSFHALVVVALGFYGINNFDAFSFANISFFSVQIVCNVTFGILALLLLPYLNQKKKGASRH